MSKEIVVDNLSFKLIDDRNHFGLLKIFSNKNVIKYLNNDFISINMKVKNLENVKNLYKALTKLKEYFGYFVFYHNKIVAYIDGIRRGKNSFVRLNFIQADNLDYILDQCFKFIELNEEADACFIKHNKILTEALRKSKFLRHKRRVFFSDEYFVLYKNILKRLIEVDNAYTAEFSKYKKVVGGIAFYDDKFKDKHMNNYLMLDNYYTADDLKWYYHECKKNYLGFSSYKGINTFNESMFSFLAPYEHENIVYLCAEGDISEYLENKHPAAIIKAISEDTADDFIRVMYLESKSYGEDFAKRNAARYYDVVVNGNGNIKYYFIYIDNMAVGFVSAICKDRILKLEDFYISPQYQRMGYGETLFRYVIQRYDYRLIYVVALKNSSVVEMYKKWGLKLIGEGFIIRKDIEK